MGVPLPTLKILELAPLVTRSVDQESEHDQAEGGGDNFDETNE